MDEKIKKLTEGDAIVFYYQWPDNRYWAEVERGDLFSFTLEGDLPVKPGASMEEELHQLFNLYVRETIDVEDGCMVRHVSTQTCDNKEKHYSHVQMYYEVVLRL